MKTVFANLTPELRAETDFEYVKQLPMGKRSAIVFYEYWRHSPAHVQLVDLLRQTGFFNAESKKAELDPATLERLVSRPEIFPISALYFLVRCDGFPLKPLSATMQGAEIEQKLPLSLGGAGLGPVPWAAIQATRTKLAEAGVGEPECYERQMGDETTLHAIQIPWKHTDRELTAFFAKMIIELRPRELPPPQKAGRTGRSPGAGALDMLNQLAALRMHRAQIDYDQAARSLPFVTRKGWLKAIGAARDRIWKISLLPLFAGRSRAKTGTK